MAHVSSLRQRTTHASITDGRSQGIRTAPMVSHDPGRLPHSTRLVEPQIMDTLRREDAVLTQIHMLQTQLQRLGPYTMYTDGGWEYGGDGMDAPFHPYTDSPSHKGGGSILFLTTDLRRIQTNHTSQEDQITKDIDHVAIRIDHSE